MHLSQKTITIILLILALGLGIAIYVKRNLKPADQTGSASKPNPPASAPDSTGNLTEDEKVLLTTPGKDATKEQVDTLSALAAKLATPGDTITIKDCAANPVVLKTKFGSTITVTNAGSTDVHFGVGDERTVVAAGKSAKVALKYKNGPGLYGYGCDDPSLNRAIGIMLLTQ